MTKVLSFTLILITLFSDQIHGCTAFLLKRQGKNLLCFNRDYLSSSGHLMINPRDIKKSAIPFPGEVSAKWTSKYGSVSISFARDESGEGINEMGLAIVALALENEGNYPDIDEKPMVDNFQWIQYMLDNCSTVEEVQKVSKLIKISPQSTSHFHYMIADAKGNYAVVAYINKELKFFLNDKSTGNFISNDCFTRSAGYLKEYGFGGIKKVNFQFEDFSSKEAVVMGATMIQKFRAKKNYNMEDYAFKIMSKVEAPRSTPKHSSYGTQWSIQYDVNNKRIAFKTMGNKDIRRINLNKIDFSCTNSIKAVPVVKTTSQNIYSQFKDLPIKENVELLYNFATQFLIEKGIIPAVSLDLKNDLLHAAQFPYLTYKCK